ncbi:Charged multivesicular body protein 6 [Caenorhabditis elegans]|uniref:Charged multivesicular body protein 6 n=1 Tax=Caenorhabditis elegans TaxID=6239 RepID=Q9BL60_CAEEL|nr:Charged multivesicular body protein 6 [Caenorhabditis elegans]CCD71921.1 Charged multivesicular body protein 6 [Caenorhabditis elegans]|eukprot:NP_490762.1 related to yeast Vacuolar Protein Sorting factor [Caenorhabditis elegans]
MGGIFSKKEKSPKSAPVSDQDNAILALKTQRDKMKQMIKRKENCLEKERQLAKQLIKDGRKDRALLLLKKKRYQEKIIDQTLNHLSKIEQMVNDLEFAEVQQRVTDGLRQGNEALKKMNQLFDIDEIDRIMEETKEAAEYQEEISNMLSGQLSNTDVSDVEKELEDLLAAEWGTVQLPEAPSHELPEAERERQKEKEKPRREKIALEA